MFNIPVTSFKSHTTNYSIYYNCRAHSTKKIGTGPSLSLLNWKTFPKVICKSNISLLPSKSKLKTYSCWVLSLKGQSERESNNIKTAFLLQ